jgi:hypothetical protein
MDHGTEKMHRAHVYVNIGMSLAGSGRGDHVPYYCGEQVFFTTVESFAVSSIVFENKYVVLVSMCTPTQSPF